MDLYQIYQNQIRPWPTWVTILFIFGFGILLFLNLFFHKRKRTKVYQIIESITLYIYVFIVLSSTLFTRVQMPQHMANLKLFWSYQYIYVTKDMGLLQEVILNIFMLMPIGILIPITFGKRVNFSKTVFIGFLVSFFIEINQYIFRLGLFEFDDLFHNTLGVLIGYSLYALILRIHDAICKIPLITNTRS